MKYVSPCTVSFKRRQKLKAVIAHIMRTQILRSRQLPYPKFDQLRWLNILRHLL